MAIEERKTKAERRAEARAARKQAEQQERKQSQRRSITTAVGVVVILAFVGGGIFFALDDGAAVDAGLTLAAAEVEDARAAAGCEVLAENEPLDNATHWSVAEAPPADTLYAAAASRPNNSGPHYEGVNQPLGSVPSQPIDERSLTHNLEHGSVVAWFDPEQVDEDTVSAMQDWMTDRQALGFEARSGGNVFVSPAAQITSGKAIALRAWGQSVDCDSWDQDVADGFLIDYWGTHGIAPERPLSPYPEDALAYSDQATDDNTEAPTTDRHGDDDDPDVGTESESDADTTDGDAEDAAGEDG